MPRFEVLSVADAMERTRWARGGSHLLEYVGYINQVGPGQAGKLTPTGAETGRAVRLRLSTAAKVAGRTLRIARGGDDLYFWAEAPRPRRRRLRKGVS